MVVNKLLASFIYFFLFLNAEFSPDTDGTRFDIPVWARCGVCITYAIDAGSMAWTMRSP